jgi:hypothetical protein
MAGGEYEFCPLSKSGIITFHSIQTKTAGEAFLTGGQK